MKSIFKKFKKTPATLYRRCQTCGLFKTYDQDQDCEKCYNNLVELKKELLSYN